MVALMAEYSEETMVVEKVFPMENYLGLTLEDWLVENLENQMEHLMVEKWGEKKDLN
jgi:hypothetical protein